MKVDRWLGVWMVIFALTLTAAAAAESGFGPPPERGPRPEKMIEKLAKEVELTKEQQAKMLADLKKVEADGQKIREQNRAYFETIKKELVKDNPDSAIIHDSIRKINDNEVKTQIMRIDQLIELRQQLTPQQRQRLDELMSKRQARGPEREKRWRP